tara:strand:+ start:480 stop:734 length:255 start_codon:yes stop_codon:yes gene_type:complete
MTAKTINLSDVLSLDGVQMAFNGKILVVYPNKSHAVHTYWRSDGERFTRQDGNRHDSLMPKTRHSFRLSDLQGCGVDIVDDFDA